MPISNTSRYFGLDVYQATDAKGVTHPTVAIRPAPPAQPDITFYRQPLTGVDNIEYLAWRQYGSSDSWWRIADANDLIFPLDLAPGLDINIPAPGDVGRIVRTRGF